MPLVIVPRRRFILASSICLLGLAALSVLVGFFLYVSSVTSSTTVECSSSKCPVSTTECYENRCFMNSAAWNDDFECRLIRIRGCHRTRTPTAFPTQLPSVSPTSSPSPAAVPSQSPTELPSTSPTQSPSPQPSQSPTELPSTSPTQSPSPQPSQSPTNLPTTSPSPSPTELSTLTPSSSPSQQPSKSPTINPTQSPTASPSKLPTKSPTESPTKQPTTSPTKSPSMTPTESPTRNPTVSPSRQPTKSPTKSPTSSPTRSPIVGTESPTPPSPLPTTLPTLSPSRSPTASPSRSPTKSPTISPSESPTNLPSPSPTRSPTKSPTTSPVIGTVAPTPPSPLPTSLPTKSPSQSPSRSPSQSPSQSPTRSPTSSPSRSPTRSPTLSPTGPPTFSPTCTRPVVYYRFDEGSGLVAQDTISSSAPLLFNLTAANSTWIPGKIGSSAIQIFSQSNVSPYYPASRTNFTNVPVADAISISVWFKTSTGGGHILSFGVNNTDGNVNGQRRVIGVTGAGIVVGGSFGAANVENSVYSTSDALNNQWHHLVSITGAGKLSKLYYDNTLVHNSVLSGLVTPFSVAVFRLGRSYQALNTNPYVGAIDDLAVFDFELNAAQVSAMWNNGVGLTALGCCCPAPPTPALTSCVAMLNANATWSTNWRSMIRYPTPAPAPFALVSSFSNANLNVGATPPPSPTYYLSTSTSVTSFVAFSGFVGHSEQAAFRVFKTTSSFSLRVKWTMNNNFVQVLLITLYQRPFFLNDYLSSPGFAGTVTGASGYDPNLIYLQYRGGNTQYSLFGKNEVQLGTTAPKGYTMSTGSGAVTTTETVWIDYDASTKIVSLYLAGNSVVKPSLAHSSFFYDLSSKKDAFADIFFNIGASAANTASTVNVFDYELTSLNSACSSSITTIACIDYSDTGRSWISTDWVAGLYHNGALQTTGLVPEIWASSPPNELNASIVDNYMYLSIKNYVLAATNLISAEVAFEYFRGNSSFELYFTFGGLITTDYVECRLGLVQTHVSSVAGPATIYLTFTRLRTFYHLSTRFDIHTFISAPLLGPSDRESIWIVYDYSIKQIQLFRSLNSTFRPSSSDYTLNLDLDATKTESDIYYMMEAAGSIVYGDFFCKIHEYRFVTFGGSSTCPNFRK